MAIGSRAGAGACQRVACFADICCADSFPKESIPPKFHTIAFEHMRIMKAVGSCGNSTEEGIEGLHRDGNRHDNVVSNIQNDVQRLEMTMNTQHNRANATKQLSLKKRTRSTS